MDSPKATTPDGTRTTVREERGGRRGGTYWWVLRQAEFVHVSEIASRELPEHGYELELPRDTLLLKFDFSNSGHLSAALFRVEDAGEARPADIFAYLKCEHACARALARRLRSAPEVDSLARDLRQVRRELEEFLRQGTVGFHAVGKTQHEALVEDIDRAILEALAQHEQAAKSIRAAHRQLGPFVVLKELARVLKAWPRGDWHVGRRWKENGALPHLHIEDGGPNLVLQTATETFSVWVSFQPFVTLRPDLFVLRGEHDSPFAPSMHPFLAAKAADADFVARTNVNWERGLRSVFPGFAGVPSESMQQLDAAELLALAREVTSHLKPGLVIQSIGEARDDPRLTEDDLERLARNRALLPRQTMVVVSWQPSGQALDGYEVIKNFRDPSWRPSAAARLAQLATTLPRSET